MAKQAILLKAGTNEVEIAEFMLGSQCFGVNVAKIREFIQYDPSAITKVPDSPHSVLGVISLRGQTLPLIDLNLHLNRDDEKRSTRPVVMVTDFNSMINGFLTDGVRQIHRLSWNDIKPFNCMAGASSSRITGSIHIEEREILILDLEYIISELFPQTSMDSFDVKGYTEDQKYEMRKGVRLFIAEDSTLIRNKMVTIISSTGYTNISTFDNGLAIYEAVATLKNKAQADGTDINNLLNLVILDIEMPQMDGLTVCKKIKSELQITHIPVIMFSSLINKQMAEKCKSVGADGFITKPEIGHLVELIDKFCLKD